MNVAIKIEKAEVSHFNSLTKEVLLNYDQIEILKTLEGVQCVPKVIWSGSEKGMRIMILNLLGKDLIH